MMSEGFKHYCFVSVALYLNHTLTYFFSIYKRFPQQKRCGKSALYTVYVTLVPRIVRGKHISVKVPYLYPLSDCTFCS
jgi:hypothetical protein